MDTKNNNRILTAEGKSGLPIAGLVIGVVALIIVIAWAVIFAETASIVGEKLQDSTFMQGLDSAFQQEMDSVMQAQDSIK